MKKKDPRLKIGLPIALWKNNELEAFSQARTNLEENFSERKVMAFSIQTPSALIGENYIKQLQSAKKVTVIHVQAPIEYENSLTNFDLDLNKTLELASGLKGTFAVNYHVGVMLTNQNDIKTYLSNHTNVREKCIDNFRTIADKAISFGIPLTLENEPALLIKNIRTAGLRPAIFPFGTVSRIKELIKDIDRQNVGLAFDTAHWAVNQSLPDVLDNEKLIDAYFPGEDIKMNLLNIFDCNSWEDLLRSEASWEEALNSASVYHLSNTTGIGVGLHGQDAEDWGKDGTKEGLIKKQDMKMLIATAKESGKPVMIELALDLENLNYAEVKDFLQWLNS